MIDLLGQDFHMWFVISITGLAVILFSMEKYPLEVTSVALLTILLLFGQLFPLYDANGHNMLDAQSLLAGFANPALIAVLALLVMGQGVIQTDALRPLINIFVRENNKTAWLSVAGIITLVLVFSAFLNNTPLVVIAIPIMQALASKAGVSESRIMMPLSYAAILGGMTTLIGSSTNLLVANVLKNIGYEPLGFTDFTVPGSIMAGVGMVYTLFILPRVLPDRSSMAKQFVGDEKEFVAEMDVAEDSKLIGMECVEGRFTKMPEVNIRLIQRLGSLILPPFEGYKIEVGDILIVSAKRTALMEQLSKYHGFLLSEDDDKKDDKEAKIIKAEKVDQDDEIKEVFSEEEKKEEKDEDVGGAPNLEDTISETRVLAEIMISPASKLIDMSLEQAGMRQLYGVMVLGIQRRARVVRRRMGRIRLESGDVLLVSGTLGEIDALRHNRDVIVLSGSKKELPLPKKAPVAWGIFLSTVIMAVTGFISITVAAITGAVLMMATGCLNVRQATRSIDRKIFLLVGSMLALGTCMQATGGASYIADRILNTGFAESPLQMATTLFILVAVMTNVLSNNACAILFTPIAVDLAVNMGVDPYVFAILVILGANCSFASPMGYKTNLMVMGPGHYRFFDFLRAGVPLVMILWVTYALIARFYYGL